MQMEEDKCKDGNGFNAQKNTWYNAKLSRTWNEHAGETITVPHSEYIFKGTEVKAPNCSRNSVSHVGFSHWRTPHVPVYLQTQMKWCEVIIELLCRHHVYLRNHCHKDSKKVEGRFAESKVLFFRNTLVKCTHLHIHIVHS